MKIQGKALIMGDNVNTDVLHPSRFFSLDDRTVRSGFLQAAAGYEQVGGTDLAGRVIVAGENFGCGSSRETGARAFLLAGVRAVVARSLARIFSRNVRNLGLPAVECPSLPQLAPDAVVELDLAQGRLYVPADSIDLPLTPLDPYWAKVFEAGGLLPFLGLGEAADQARRGALPVIQGGFMTAAAQLHGRQQLCENITAFIRRADEGQVSEAELESLALEVFAFQFANIAAYQRLCRGLGRTPDTVTSWRGIPAVPALAFKQYSLFAGPPDAIAKTFRSSGTTEPGRNSQAHFSRAGLELMDTAIAAGARARLFPDGRRTRILVLTPPPEQVPHMIMVHGMAHLMKVYGFEGSRFLSGPGGLDFAALWTELDGCQQAGVPVSLIGASFGFVHFFDWMQAEGRRLELPAGSRLMDAGGYKGRSREIGRDAFVRWATEMCGVPRERVMNLLGMTELASQIYDWIAPEQSAHGAARMKLPPRWARTEVVDPRRLGPDGPEPVADGEVGLLRHLDLANVERPIMVQSEDVGRCVSANAGGERSRGFEILGRAKGAEPRGCSLSAEEFASPRRRGEHDA